MGEAGRPARRYEIDRGTLVKLGALLALSVAALLWLGWRIGEVTATL